MVGRCCCCGDFLDNSFHSGKRHFLWSCQPQKMNTINGPWPPPCAPCRWPKQSQEINRIKNQAKRNCWMKQFGLREVWRKDEREGSSTTTTIWILSPGLSFVERSRRRRMRIRSSSSSGGELSNFFISRQWIVFFLSPPGAKNVLLLF